LPLRFDLPCSLHGMVILPSKSHVVQYHHHHHHYLTE
jgi:hypothetical protein